MLSGLLTISDMSKASAVIRQSTWTIAVLRWFSFKIESYHSFVRSLWIISHISNDSTAISQLRHWEMETYTPHTKSHYTAASLLCLSKVHLPRFNPALSSGDDEGRDATSGINIWVECEFVVLATSSSLCDQVGERSKLKSSPKLKFKHGNRPRHPVCTFYAENNSQLNRLTNCGPSTKTRHSASHLQDDGAYFGRRWRFTPSAFRSNDSLSVAIHKTIKSAVALVTHQVEKDFIRHGRT